MSESFMQYTTSEGDRWDLIAYKYYGDATMIDKLILANPYLSLAEEFKANLTIYIPIIHAKKTAQEDMPPWLR